VVCGSEGPLVKVVIAVHKVVLCQEHAAYAGGADDLVSFFALPEVDRRIGGDRRAGERRLFPRAETRRHNQGRRASDPRV
jgi:hypothetical protein